VVEEVVIVERGESRCSSSCALGDVDVGVTLGEGSVELVGGAPVVEQGPQVSGSRSEHHGRAVERTGDHDLVGEAPGGCGPTTNPSLVAGTDSGHGRTITFQPMAAGRTPSRFISRGFAAGAFRFAVDANDRDDVDLVERLFADLDRPGPDEPLTGTYQLDRVEGTVPVEWVIDGPRLEQQPPLGLAAMLTRFMSAVNIAALDLEPGSLHLHAAAAARGGRAVVIAAEQNTGKTTTVSHIVSRGWEFITDETVRLGHDDGAVHGFPKPVSIKPGGAHLVELLVSHMVPAHEVGVDSFHFVALGAAGARTAASAAPMLIVLLRRNEHSSDSPTSREVPAADAVVALMQNTLDAERHGSAASRLADLVAIAPCVEVTVGPPDETAALIERLAEAPTRPPFSVDVLPGSPTVDVDVVSVKIDDRMVVHHRRTGQIFALDPMGSIIWEQLGGWVDHGIDLAGPGVADLVGQLASLDVLRDTPGRSR